MPLYQLIELADRLRDHHRLLEVALRRAAFYALPDRYRGFTEGEHAIHDSLYLHGRTQKSLCDDPALRHVILFCPRILIPDETLDWAEDISYHADIDYPIGDERAIGRQLIYNLKAILPLERLIRQGFAVPIGSSNAFDPDIRPR